MSAGMESPRPKLVVAATAFCAVTVIGVNVALAAGQIADHFSWGAIYIAVMGNLLANCILLSVFTTLTPVVRRIARGASVKLYIFAAVGLPLVMLPCQAYLPYALFGHR
jgi:hypothetical protein